LASGGIQVIEETQVIDGMVYNVLGVDVVDLDVVFKSVEELCVKVQTIKSEGRGQEYRDLVSTYTTGPVTIEQGNRYRSIAQANMKAVAGSMNIVASVIPEYIPIVVSSTVVDVKCEW